LLEAADQDHLAALDLLLYLKFSKQVHTAADWDSAALIKYINERTRPGRAEVQLARLLLQKQRIGADTNQAIMLLQQAAAAGYPEAAAYALLIQLEQKQITDQQASSGFEQLAAAGSSVAAYLYVSDLLQQPSLSPAEKADIVPLLQQSAKAGHPEAYYLLGVAAETGLTDDPTKAATAAHYFQLAAERYFPRAMLKLGAMYRAGDGVAKDPHQASRWFYLCTRQGNAQCAFFAAVMLEDGEGIAADPQAALRLYQYAVAQGHTGAMNRLALMYLHGAGIAADIPKGLQLLQQAAAQQSQIANYYLGVLYFEGKLVARDLAQAHQFFASAGDYEQARYYLQNWQQLTQKPAAIKQ
jgi:TPR repeat protein